MKVEKRMAENYRSTDEEQAGERVGKLLFYLFVFASFSFLFLSFSSLFLIFSFLHFHLFSLSIREFSLSINLSAFQGVGEPLSGVFSASKGLKM